ncbi:U-box domain-containing protein 35-like [Camellia sinensis]|uniref:U-box domain-containing protein 35-like n=1 Tax=Camellia sinensis TaxID=4442 RepID=UPI001035B0B3|nr:U-box domain-containing protein 35-like [Camellia sinensis]
MDGSEIIEARGLLGLPPPPSLIVAVAINGNRKSKYVVKWALEKFVPDGKSIFKLLHVRPNITAVPSPMGNFIPLSQVRDDIADAYRKEVEWQTNEKLLPYKKMCTQKKVQVEILQIESDDVVYAISNEITKSTINKLVIGTSSRGMFSRGRNFSSKISESAPSFCTVYAVSKGKLSSLRPSDLETIGSIKDDSSETSCSNNDSSSYSSSSQAEWTDPGSVPSYTHFRSPSLPMQRFQALSTINQTLLHKKTNSTDTSHSRISSLDIREVEDVMSSCPSTSDIGCSNSRVSSFRSLITDNQSWISDPASTSDAPSDLSSEIQVNYFPFYFDLGSCFLGYHNSEFKYLSKLFIGFQLEILSNIHHPHLLILLGACPDHGCLVYEYMENGSLEDRLLRKNNTPPIPWFDRYRIAWEIASALVFLHNSKPQPIIHRDLKPANILLDHNFVSKIGDVGLSKMLNSESSAISTLSKDTGPVGTLCYIDPEYQRTGLISQSSDVYAFGMVILQLLTAKPAIALAHTVELAVEDGHLADLLDIEAGQWPIEETKELAVLGLKCAELRRRDRPDLRDHVLPELERLKEFADRAPDMASNAQLAPPNLFMCPILKDVMEDPCVAADGYTYDRKAIEIWLKEDDKSPMTNLPLPDKSLIPNYTLLSAIMEWKSGKQ